MKKYLIVLVLSLLVIATQQSLYAQNDSSGSVELVKDYRIDALVKKQSQINKVAVLKNSRGEYKGYRVMVLNTNDRNLAYKTRSDLLRSFPAEGVYMAYQSPYFKIKAGDFLKRADADKYKKELATMFKQTMFVIQDIIRLKPEDEAMLLKEQED